MAKRRDRCLFYGLIFCMCVYLTPVCSRVIGVQSSYVDIFNAAESSGSFQCLDGSLTVPFSSVNDEICDCADGSDEPGTSACAVLSGNALIGLPQKWMFQCTNEGFPTQEFAHSRVNDGICDCCDGSDEADSPVQCPNRCREVAAELLRQQEAEAKRLRLAAENKAVMRKEAEKRREETAKSLVDMKAEYARIKEEVPKLEQAKVDAEAEQEAQRAELQARWSEQETILKEKEAADDTSSCIQWRQTGGCSPNGPRESKNDKPCSSVVGGGDSGYCECDSSNNDDAQSPDVGNGVQGQHDRGGLDNGVPIVTYNFSCNHQELTCLYVCDHNGEVGVERVPERYPNPATFSTTEAKDAAAALASRKARLFELETNIESAQKLLSSSTITSEELLRVLENKEFLLDFHYFTYVLTMFDKVYQRGMGKSSGGLHLGTWKGFAEKTYSAWAKDTHDLSYMIYDNGQRCWNGVIRNVEVHVICGPENKLTQVEEPSMCNYRMAFETPAVCDDGQV